MEIESQYHFFGITNEAPHKLSDKCSGLQFVEYKNLAAVLYPKTYLETDIFDKNKLVSFLKLYQSTLEDLHNCKTILPIQLNTLSFNKMTIEQILKDYYCQIDLLINHMQNKTEFEVQVVWTNIEQALKQLASTQIFINAMQSRPNSNNGNKLEVEDQLYAGRLLSEMIEAKKKTIEKETIAILAPFSCNFKTLPLIHDSLASHVSFLIDSKKEDVFFTELDKFSKLCEFSSVLKFKAIGPLVPYNFATISINYLSGLEIDNLRSLLKIPGDVVSEKELKKQMRELALIHHPDKDKTQEEIFKKIIDAYKLISNLIELEPAKVVELSKYKERYVLTVPGVNKELVLI